MDIVKKLQIFRRIILKTIVPEFVWPTVVSIDGADIPLRNQPYSFGVKRCLLKGNYETAERRLLKRFMKPGMQVLEFGGSIGVISAVIAQIIGPSGRIVSVEADENLAMHSGKVFGKYGHLEFISGFAFPVWKLNENFTVTAFDGTNGSLGGTVSFCHGASPEDGGIGQERIWDIARVCRETELKPDVFICDIEGAESVMLDVRPNWPRSIENVLIEIHPHKLPNRQHDVQKICDVITNEGFMLKESEGWNRWFARVS